MGGGTGTVTTSHGNQGVFPYQALYQPPTILPSIPFHISVVLIFFSSTVGYASDSARIRAFSRKVGDTIQPQVGVMSVGIMSYGKARVSERIWNLGVLLFVFLLGEVVLYYSRAPVLA